MVYHHFSINVTFYRKQSCEKKKHFFLWPLNGFVFMLKYRTWKLTSSISASDSPFSNLNLRQLGSNPSKSVWGICKCREKFIVRTRFYCGIEEVFIIYIPNIVPTSNLYKRMINGYWSTDHSWWRHFSSVRTSLHTKS